jgi:Icc-related predicted phosphoesterase
MARKLANLEHYVVTRSPAKNVVLLLSMAHIGWKQKKKKKKKRVGSKNLRDLMAKSCYAMLDV